MAFLNYDGFVSKVDRKAIGEGWNRKWYGEHIYHEA